MFILKRKLSRLTFNRIFHIIEIENTMNKRSIIYYIDREFMVGENELYIYWKVAWE